MRSLFKKGLIELNLFLRGNLNSYLSSRNVKLLDKNNELLNLYNGERIFIFFSGSSLHRVEFDKFSSEYVMGVNFLSLHHRFSDLNADFYCFTSSWNSSQSKLLAWGLQIVYTSVSKKCKLFLNSSAKFWISNFDFCGLSDYARNFEGDTYYVNADKFIMGSRHKANCNLPREMHGVFSRSIGIAIDLGFKEIFLIGADYSKDPLLVGHFYGSELFETQRTEEEILLHRNIKSFAERNGVEIINVVDSGQSSPIYNSRQLNDIYEKLSEK